ncbi:MAG: hypothetical protein GX621_11810 [Pirellulaceae bacterium]|nr:hypothetical protein [Pirellulaceae bacterium]
MNRKPPTESNVLDRLRHGEVALPPLRLKIVEPGPADGWDALVVASWRDQQAKFAVECRAQSTPKGFAEALRWCRSTPLPPDTLPMVLLPHLRESQLRELERNGMSGVDLCGNGLVLAPGRFSVFRTGAPNQFPTYAPIKNIYRKNTSMVARVFLAMPFFESVREIRETVNARDLLAACSTKTPMGLGTVSKALKVLEEDQIVDRSQGVRLIQPEKLIEALNDNYNGPGKEPRVRLKVEGGKANRMKLLREAAEAASLPVAATGLASVARYAVMQREDVLSVYCPRVADLRERLPGKETDQFANVELIESDQQPLYFDTREEDGFRWASPVQTYLELMSGDKRDRETAEQVRAYLLDRLGAVKR